jgi:hypothetical protein
VTDAHHVPEFVHEHRQEIDTAICGAAGCDEWLMVDGTTVDKEKGTAISSNGQVEIALRRLTAGAE